MNKVLFMVMVYLPGTGPHTRGIISNIAEHDGSSKHSCRARIQFKMAIAILTLGPVMKQTKKPLELVFSKGLKKPTVRWRESSIPQSSTSHINSLNYFSEIIKHQTS